MAAFFGLLKPFFMNGFVGLYVSTAKGDKRKNIHYRIMDNSIDFDMCHCAKEKSGLTTTTSSLYISDTYVGPLLHYCSEIWGRVKDVKLKGAHSIFEAYSKCCFCLFRLRFQQFFNHITTVSG